MWQETPLNPDNSVSACPTAVRIFIDIGRISYPDGETVRQSAQLKMLASCLFERATYYHWVAEWN